MKKVMLILIDALMPETLENAIASGKAPALAFLHKNGVYHSECVTAFPTMTASVDATLMTGVYPEQHKIPGLIWYHADEKRLIDYVNGTKTVLSLGLHKTATDVLIHLNEKHMSKQTKTIFEELADHGITSGSINFIIHRGRKTHHINPPFMLNLVTKFSLHQQPISGPDVLSVGAMVKPRFPGRSIPWKWNQTIFQHFGINDDYAIEVTFKAIASGNQSDLMMIYLPNHDHFIHKNIHQPLISLERVDKKIATLLNAFGSWEDAIKQNIFIIIGDHGQTEIGKGEQHNIDLDGMFQGYKIARVGKKVTDQEEVIFANNERMVYIYPLQKEKQSKMTSILLEEDRIDFLAWKQGEEEVVVKNHLGLSLTFSKGTTYTDIYGIGWDIDGDFKLLDIRRENTTIMYHDYPDALSRLYGALFSQKAEVIAASAKPSYEFKSKTFPMHVGGGSHGSLHRIDSVVPLLVSGAEKLPQPNIRLVDLKDYLLHLFNITSTTTG